MFKISAFSFDMYRTIFDTRDFHEQAVKEILIREKSTSVNPNEFHTRWDKLYDEVHAEMAPVKFLREREVAVESLKRLFKEFGINGDAEVGVSIWLDKYEKGDLYPEVEEVLNKLSENFPIIIISNVDNDDLGFSIVKNKKLPLKAILTSESYQSYKPHRRMFQEAVSILKCKPEEILHVGDSQSADVVGARRAGFQAAWLNRRGDKLKPGIPKPDFVIADLRELLNIIDSL
ncbi:HAD-IA family hydrolase [Candidatus Poribacteria bacterium]|nr:HAD-IA family hydrolase [Candidatus Poribacteria bacterium]